MLNKGCFKYCSNCKLDINCCQNFNNINQPTINDKERQEIEKKYFCKNFCDFIDKNIFQLKTINNNCIFYRNNVCSIYKDRPLDCRLFPYDIIKLNNKYYLIIYKLNCINSDFSEENVDGIISKIKPWIKDFTDERNYTKMKKLKYKIIKEIVI